MALFPTTYKIGLIYGLVDPRYGVIRYIGQTVSTIEKRFKRHMKDIKESNKTTLKISWLRKLHSLNLKPSIIILEKNIKVPFVSYLKIKNKFIPFYDYDVIDKEETLFISITREECASFGITCVNGTDGGDGFRGGSWSDEAKERHSKRMLGNKYTLGIAPWNKGKKGIQVPWNKGFTKETSERVAKISKTKTGHTVSELTRSKIRNKLTGRSLSNEHKETIRKSMKNSEKFQKVMNSKEYKNKFLGTNNSAHKKYMRITIEAWS